MTNLRAALVSGAGIGIGAATAKALGADGFHVFVTDILADEGENCVREIESAGGTATFVSLDVTDTSACNDAIQRIERDFGHVSALVANIPIVNVKSKNK